MKLIFNQPRGKWPDELIKVVWSHNTILSRSTGFTPFKLLFGDEAITPEEAKAGSIRTVASAEDEADYSMAKDAIEGIKLQAVENINKYQAKTIKWHDRKVRLKNIRPGHLVLRRVEAKAGSIRTVASAEDEADYSVAKDAIEGIRLQAVENINKYQAETINWRDRKVWLKNIKPGHLVLRRVAKGSGFRLWRISINIKPKQ